MAYDYDIFGEGDPGGGSGPDFTDPTLGSDDSNSGMVVDPTTGDVYDRDGNFVGNMNDSKFGGPGLTTEMGGAGGGGSSSSLMASLAKMLGLGSNSSALPLILSALGIGAGAYMNYRNTGKATGQLQDAIAKAQGQASDLLGGTKAAYQPYADLGPYAIANLKGLPSSNLANDPRFTGTAARLSGMFGPLASGKGIGGSPTFAQLMGK